MTTPSLGTPPFPDHTSGHGCLSGTVLNALAAFFGTDKLSFSVVSGRSLNGDAARPPSQKDLGGLLSLRISRLEGPSSATEAQAALLSSARSHGLRSMPTPVTLVRAWP